MADKKSKKKKKGTGGGGGNKWLLVGLGFLVFAGVFLFRQAMKVSVTGGYFRIHKLEGTSLDVRVFLNVLNEGNARLDVQNFVGQLFYKQTSLGVVTLAFPAQIPPMGQQELEFKSLISLTTVGFEIFDLIKNGKNQVINPADFTIRGTLRAEGFNIPINEQLLTA